MSGFFDYTGKEIKASEVNNFVNNTDVDYAYDESTGANYTVIRIYKNKLDGTKQYPFVYAPYGTGTSTVSTKDIVDRDGWLFAINAGVFDTTHCTPDGIVIQNGTVVKNSPTVTHQGCKPLTIDADGNLSYAEANANAATLVSNGIVSAVCGFMPIIVNYALVPQSEWNPVSHYTENAQRQIFGQFGNGDYAVVTCEGRNNDNSDGWTIAEAQTVCKKLGLKFAYNLDGGGSTETMFCGKHFNTIYENVTGRKVPTFIVFNGTDSFNVPNE
jgi:exopolysaccharide biosynthesis protein